MKFWKLKRELKRIWRQVTGQRRPSVSLPHPVDTESGSTIPASVERTVQPRCTVVAMVRNEAANAHEVMRHFCALFDCVVVIDHLSVDDTAAIVAGYDGHGGCSVVMLRSNETGYYQADYMTACARAIIDGDTADWVFFLDFDEFLPFASRGEFHQALVPFAHADVVHGHWLNCVPIRPRGALNSGIEVVTAEAVSRYVKIAINARRLKGRDVTIEQGNHAVRIDRNPATQSGGRAFGVLHFPVMSAERLERKIREGVAAYDATRGGPAANGFHWREMLDRLDTLRADPDLLTEIVLRYGEPLATVIQDYQSKPTDRISRRTFRARFAQVAAAAPKTDVGSTEVDRESLGRRLHERLAGARPGRDAAAVVPFAAVYGSLPAADSRADLAIDDASIMCAVMAGTQHLDFVMPTAWAGHEPFLFTLMEAMRPRRYVELGTHAGQSFFAACQHYKSHGDYGEAVAIDLWQGDKHAGLYGEQIFERFRAMLRQHYAASGRYIRSRFTEAAVMFEPDSIDLLHIDGLHTYAAVREDYETWRPKLTEAGAVLFHDTSEYQSDFGVWQYFEEVRPHATACFNFRHSHGLGVLAFGPESAPAVQLLRRFATAPAAFERHYAILGAAMVRSRQADFGDVGSRAA